MPNEISIKAVAAVSGANDISAEPHTTSPRVPGQVLAAPGAGPIPNPQLRLDPALGLVVIEFRDDAGTVTTSIPSQRQLEAYRMWEQGRARLAGSTESEIGSGGPLPGTGPQHAAGPAGRQDSSNQAEQEASKSEASDGRFQGSPKREPER